MTLSQAKSGVLSLGCGPTIRKYCNDAMFAIAKARCPRTCNTCPGVSLTDKSLTIASHYSARWHTIVDYSITISHSYWQLQ